MSVSWGGGVDLHLKPRLFTTLPIIPKNHKEDERQTYDRAADWRQDQLWWRERQEDRQVDRETNTAGGQTGAQTKLLTHWPIDMKGHFITIKQGTQIKTRLCVPGLCVPKNSVSPRTLCVPRFWVLKGFLRVNSGFFMIRSQHLFWVLKGLFSDF